MHQVISTEPGKIMYRKISCTMVNLQIASTDARANDNYLNGKFILVKYKDQPFVGQVLQVINDEIEVSCMQQLGGKNLFTWPHLADNFVLHN